MENCVHKQRVMTEIKILAIQSDVQSYFHYESSRRDKNSNNFCIYGYLLPRTEPYKHGAYKIRIILPIDFPYKKTILELLIYIYHPAIDNNILTPRFCNKCSGVRWKIGIHISDWLEQYVNIIERPDIRHGMFCIGNTEAEKLYDRNRVEYEQKALIMVQQYSHPRPYH